MTRMGTDTKDRRLTGGNGDKGGVLLRCLRWLLFKSGRARTWKKTRSRKSQIRRGGPERTKTRNDQTPARPDLFAFSLFRVFVIGLVFPLLLLWHRPVLLDALEGDFAKLFFRNSVFLGDLRLVLFG